MSPEHPLVSRLTNPPRQCAKFQKTREEFEKELKDSESPSKGVKRVWHGCYYSFFYWSSKIFLPETGI